MRHQAWYDNDYEYEHNYQKYSATCTQNQGLIHYSK